MGLPELQKEEIVSSFRKLLNLGFISDSQDQSIEEDGFVNRDVDVDNQYPAITKSQNSTGSLIMCLKLNGERYNSTRYYDVFIIKTKKTEEEKQQAELCLAWERLVKKIHRENRTSDRKSVLRSPECDWYQALEKEARKPTMVNSQVQTILNILATRTPRQYRSDNERLSKNGVKATQTAQQVLDLKSKIVALMRAKEKYDQVAPSNQGTKIEQNHVLSSIPLHMRMISKKCDAMTVAEGRIEYGTDSKWTPKKRGIQEIFPPNSNVKIEQKIPSIKKRNFHESSSGSDTKQESSPHKRLRLRLIHNQTRIVATKQTNS